MDSAATLVLAGITGAKLQAQTPVVTLNGVVRDSLSVPIAGVEVRLEPGLQPVFTDPSGEFWIDSLVPGRWTVRFRKPGFTPRLIDFTIQDGADGDVELDDIVLQKAEPRVVVLAGIVRDAISHRPIAAASIRVAGNEAGPTDASGRFLERIVVRGDALVEAARVGFRPVHFDLWPGNGQDTVRLAIALRPLAIELGEIVVEGDRVRTAAFPDFERHRTAGFGTFLTEERIKGLGSFSAVDLLRWAGVQVSGDVFAENGRAIRIFGAPYSCGDRGPVIMIDGRRWPTESAMAYLDATDANELVGVEVYSHLGGIPPEYNGPDAECGVVAVWYHH